MEVKEIGKLAQLPATPGREFQKLAKEVEVEALRRLYLPKARAPEALPKIQLKNPRRDEQPVEVDHRGLEAYLLPNPELPEDIVRIGNIPVQRTKRGPVLPDIARIKADFLPRPWKFIDWKLWLDLVWTINPCTAIPHKIGYVQIPVLSLTRMCQVSGDCERVFTVNDSGVGCVINVITETVEAAFTVQPDPAYPYQPLPGAPVVHPFTKGGINNKYKRLYVPASFFDETRDPAFGGFYVAVVDIDQTSATYLDTIGYIPCDWIPEEVSFTDDNEVGVIANYMQGTATIFQASSGTVLAPSVDLFPGAGAMAGGGPWARSVRCANVPGLGNRAFVTLTDSTPQPGVAIIDLDDPAYPVTNFSVNGFIDGIAVTPEKDRILLVESGGAPQLHVVRVDSTPPVLENSFNLPNSTGQSYFGGIEVRPSGNLAFVATGSANSTSPTQGTALVQVNYNSGTTLEVPGGLAAQTWGLDIKSIGSPLKPHIFVHSLSGMLTIIPC